MSAVRQAGGSGGTGRGHRGCRVVRFRTHGAATAPVLVSVCLPERGPGSGRPGDGAVRLIEPGGAVGAVAASAAAAVVVHRGIGVGAVDRSRGAGGSREHCVEGPHELGEAGDRDGRGDRIYGVSIRPDAGRVHAGEGVGAAEPKAV